MKVLYDHQIFSDQVYGGISRYFYEIMDNYARGDDIKFDISLLFSNNYYIENSSFSMHKNFFKKYNFKGKPRFLNYFNKKYSIKILKKNNYDVFHPTYYDPYFLKSIGNKPFVLTIFDMIHEVYPEIFALNDRTSEKKYLLAEKASKIIAISENTKKDIIKYFKIDHKKIEVVYLGNSLKIPDCSKVKLRLPEAYLLYVGDRHLYKNFKTFINSVAPLLNENKNMSIVCAGGKEIRLDEINLFKDLGVSGRVYHYRVRNDGILSCLYVNAAAFIYPSLYEGFGIPILEAFSCGCPVVLSDSSSFPEIAGDAAVYFDPKDSVSIREAVKNILYNDNLKKELKSKGFGRLKNFSWDKTADKTNKIYKQI